jgi:hypothetical protein
MSCDAFHWMLTWPNLSSGCVKPCRRLAASVVLFHARLAKLKITSSFDISLRGA